MKPVSTEDVLDMMDSYISSAALNTALELGLFWLVENESLDAGSIASALDMPEHRCRYWLQLLAGIGLLDSVQDRYAPSDVARRTILAAYKRETWSELATMARDRYPVGTNLASLILQPISTWTAQGLEPPGYLQSLQCDGAKARLFTRMLYDIHLPLWESLAEQLDLRGVRSVLDVGGGSGGACMALLRHSSDVSATVVDLDHVCNAGRELAREANLASRVDYCSADFLHDDLPRGYDIVLTCDTGPYTKELFRKLKSSLSPNGRLVILEQLPAEDSVLSPPWLTWAFRASLHTPGFQLPSVAAIEQPLEEAGFRLVAKQRLAPRTPVRWCNSWFLLEARPVDVTPLQAE